MKKQTPCIVYIIILAVIATTGGFLFFSFQKFPKFYAERQSPRGQEIKKEKMDIVSFAKRQEALYLTVPESNNETLILARSDLIRARSEGYAPPEMLLYGTERDENNLTTKIPAASVLASDARYITDAGEINGEQALLMPFYLDSGGSGTFLYVGLFSRIAKPRIPNQTLKHESSIFIGDRAALTGISKNSDGAFTISYLDRKEGEPFTSEPTAPRIKSVMIYPINSLTEVR